MKPKFTRGFILFAAALILMFVTLVLQPRTRATAPPPPAQTLTVTDCTSDTQLQAYIATANGESGKEKQDVKEQCDDDRSGCSGGLSGFLCFR